MGRRYGIDALKRTVPVWKKEVYGGAWPPSSSEPAQTAAADDVAEHAWKENKEWRAFLGNN